MKTVFPFAVLSCLNVEGARSALVQLRGGDEEDENLDTSAPAWSRELLLFPTDMKSSRERTGNQQPQDQDFHLG